VFFIFSGAIAGDFYDARYIWIIPLILAAMIGEKPQVSEDSRNSVAS